MTVLVTSYPTPDLDGVACSVAYAEFLEKNGKDAVAGAFGDPADEALLILEKNGMDVGDGEELVKQCEKVVFVDACKFEWVSDEIDQEDVIEVIDHRKDHFADNYPNAEAQIELVGAAATLIAERFHDTGTPISGEAGTLLYAAILDNTANFNAEVTTERDREMAEWLEQRVSPDPELIDEVFEQKSRFEGSIKKLVLDDYYTVNYSGKEIGVSQLEIVELEKFIKQHCEEVIEALKQVKEEHDLDHVFLTSADIKEGFNVILAPHPETRNLLGSALDIDFHEGKARTRKLLLRKQLMPEIKRELKRRKQ